jgi:N-acetylglucosaminyldiphosphoundecaprenol N-acetyl-beta-D-mannosaminyltransferase
VAAHRFLKLKAPRFLLARFFVLLFGGLKVGCSILFDKKWLYRGLEVIKGRVFFMDLIKLANKKGWKVFLLGGGGVAYEMKESLERSFKKVRIKAEEGPKLTQSGNPSTEKDSKKEKEVVDRINNYAPHILFVGFSPPKQEKWLNRWLPKLKVGAAMTVGGTFDYMSGRVDLPPKWMEELGLEWLWRLIKRPTDKFAPSPFRRIKRVLTAFPIFPLKVFWYKLTAK